MATPRSTNRESLEFREITRRLAALESFDPKAFVSDQSVSQDVCNFVLALALIYNDIKDLLYAYLLLEENMPKGIFRKRRDWGTYNGMKVHIIRNHVGMVFALCELIRTNAAVTRDPFLMAVVQQLPRKLRESWQEIVDVSLGKFSQGPLGQALARIRNKITFHYDPRQVFEGFQKHFLMVLSL